MIPPRKPSPPVVATFDKIPIVPTISDDEAILIMRALDHYHAYLVAAKREDKAYKDLADRLQRRPPERETTKAEKRKKA
jgi:hypothetical protein